MSTLLKKIGVADPDSEAKLAKSKEILSGMEKHLSGLAECLNMPIPDYKDDEQKKDEANTTVISCGTAITKGEDAPAKDVPLCVLHYARNRRAEFPE